MTFALYNKFEQFDAKPDALTFDVVETASLVNLLPNGRVDELQVQCDWSPIERV